MRPCPARNSGADGLVGHAVAAPQSAWPDAARSRFPNGDNIGCGQCGPRACLAPRVSPLGVTVGGVFRRAAEPEMGWVAALRVVAPMADEEAIRDWPVCQFPRHPVGAGNDSTDIHASILGSAIPEPGNPRPTRIRAGCRVYLQPKSRSELFGGILGGHRNLHSGEPVGVISTATGNVYTSNYSISGVFV